jgi:hypothetical protein
VRRVSRGKGRERCTVVQLCVGKHLFRDKAPPKSLLYHCYIECMEREPFWTPRTILLASGSGSGGGGRGVIVMSSSSLSFLSINDPTPLPQCPQ